MALPEHKTFVHWRTIWTSPRETIQVIVDDDPEQSILLLICLAGFVQFLNNASSQNMGDNWSWPSIVLVGAIVGPVSSILGLYVSSALILWSGRWIGGQAGMVHIRAAIAWSSVPLVSTLVLWLPALLVFRQEMFSFSTPYLDANPQLARLLLGFALLQILASLWGFVLLLKCLGQVQGFSAWKALGNLLLSVLLVVVPIVVLTMVVIGLSG